MAAREGYAPLAWVQQAKQVMATGIVFATEEEWLKKREKLALPSLKEGQQRFKKIIEQTGIDKIKPRIGTE